MRYRVGEPAAGFEFSLDGYDKRVPFRVLFKCGQGLPCFFLAGEGNELLGEIPEMFEHGFRFIVLKVMALLVAKATLLRLGSVVHRTYKGSHCIRTSYTTPAHSVQL